MVDTDLNTFGLVESGVLGGNWRSMLPIEAKQAMHRVQEDLKNKQVSFGNISYLGALIAEYGRIQQKTEEEVTLVEESAILLEEARRLHSRLGITFSPKPLLEEDDYRFLDGFVFVHRLKLFLETFGRQFLNTEEIERLSQFAEGLEVPILKSLDAWETRVVYDMWIAGAEEHPYGTMHPGFNDDRFEDFGIIDLNDLAEEAEREGKL